MPHRIKCCDPHCNDIITCTPTQKSGWINASTQTDYTPCGFFDAGTFGANNLCTDKTKLTFNFDMGFLGCSNHTTCVDDYDAWVCECATNCVGSGGITCDPECCNKSCQCRCYTNISGYFRWTAQDSFSCGTAYDADWEELDEQSGGSPDCMESGQMGWAMGTIAGVVNGDTCHLASDAGLCGGTGSPPDPSGIYVYTGGQMTCSSQTDLDYYATGIYIRGNLNPFDPESSLDACNEYTVGVRRITVKANGIGGGFIITWYFADGTCHYNNFAIDGNSFAGAEAYLDDQTNMGFYGTGGTGSCKLWQYLRVEDGDSTNEIDITNGSAQFYYRKYNENRYSTGLGMGLSTCGLEGIGCCEDCCSCKDTTGFFTTEWSVGCDACHDPATNWDDCPYGANLGSTWYWVPPASTCWQDYTAFCGHEVGEGIIMNSVSVTGV